MRHREECGHASSSPTSVSPTCSSHFARTNLNCNQATAFSQELPIGAANQLKLERWMLDVTENGKNGIASRHLTLVFHNRSVAAEEDVDLAKYNSVDG